MLPLKKRVDVHFHLDNLIPPPWPDILKVLNQLLEGQKRLEDKMSAAFDALKAEVEELKVSSDLAIAKIDELRLLIEDLGNAPTEEQIAEVTAKVNEIEDALEGKAQDPPPPNPEG